MQPWLTEAQLSSEEHDLKAKNKTGIKTCQEIKPLSFEAEIQQVHNSKENGSKHRRILT